METAGLIIALLTAFFGGLTALSRREKIRDMFRRRDRKILPASQPQSLSPPEKHDLLEKITSSRRIRVGFFKYPPLIDYEKVGRQMIVKGLYAEIMNRVAQQNEIQVDYIHLNVSEVLNAIEEKEVDIVLCVLQTPTRAKRTDFTALLHSVTIGGIALSGQDSIQSVSDLQQDWVRIATCSGEAAHEIIMNDYQIPRRRVKAVDTEDISEIAQLVVTGAAHIALADSISLQRFLQERKKKLPEMKHVLVGEFPMYICPNGILIPLGERRLRIWLNKQFRSIREYDDIKQLEDAILEDYSKILRRT